MGRRDGQGRAVVWTFGNVVLDGRSLELRVGGAATALEPKALEVLMVLLAHPGEVVTKDELFDAVWPGRVVTEGVLTKAVAKVRLAIGDTDQRIVRTAHGYGYRLVADVRLSAGEDCAPASAVALAAGDRVASRPNWVLVRALGEGGHGEAWLAEHAKTRERRVFKFARDSSGLAALKREITLYRLMHDTLGERPDIAQLIDWNLEDPPYFIESSHASAGSLLDWDAAIGGIAQVELPQRLRLVAQIADALGAAHGVGVLHKDIKPGNILVEFDGEGRPNAKLSDFGSGRVLDPRRLDDLGITRLGYTHTMADANGPTSGTPMYLAPETVAGHAPTMRSDIYALGILLWQLAVGDLRRPLTQGWQREIENELLREDIAACVDGDPDRRIADALELARRLRSFDARSAERERSSRARTRQEVRAWHSARAHRAGAGSFHGRVLHSACSRPPRCRCSCCAHATPSWSRPFGPTSRPRLPMLSIVSSSTTCWRARCHWPAAKAILACAKCFRAPRIRLARASRTSRIRKPHCASRWRVRSSSCRSPRRPAWRSSAHAGARKDGNADTLDLQATTSAPASST